MLHLALLAYLGVQWHQVLPDQALQSLAGVQCIRVLKLGYFNQDLQEYVECHERFMLVDCTEYQVNSFFVHQTRFILRHCRSVTNRGKVVRRTRRFDSRLWHNTSVLKHFVEFCWFKVLCVKPVSKWCVVNKNFSEFFLNIIQVHLLLLAFRALLSLSASEVFIYLSKLLNFSPWTKFRGKRHLIFLSLHILHRRWLNF